MSEAPGMLGHGSKFYVSVDTTAEPSTLLAKLTGITPPSDSVDQVDVTNMDSPDRTREFIAGFSDKGETTVTGNFIPGSDTDDFIQAWRSSGEVRPVRIEWPNGVIWDFTAFVLTYEIDAPFDDKMTFTLSMKVASSWAVGVATT